MFRRALVSVGCLAVLIGSTARAEDRDATARSVDFFAAKSSGDLEIKLIPKDATRATVIVKNTTDQPLRIELPAAFAGVPVLAQIGGLGGGGLGGGGLGGGGLGGGLGVGGGGGQSFGGGFGGGGLGGGLGGGGLGGGGIGGAGGGGGFFNLPPDSTKKIKLATVCLEHGKQDPNPRLAYDLVPIEQVTHDGQVIELCAMLGRGEIDQVSAQAAAWHLANGLSWLELANKVKVRHLNGASELFFSRRTCSARYSSFMSHPVGHSPGRRMPSRSARQTILPGSDHGDSIAVIRSCMSCQVSFLAAGLRNRYEGW